MQKCILGSGNSSLEVSALGLGCMRMSHDESPIPDKQEMIRHSLARRSAGDQKCHFKDHGTRGSVSRTARAHDGSLSEKKEAMQ